jgi:rfaE bifunctional protein nucleotidyltransferase chain/domain
MDKIQWIKNKIVSRDVLVHRVNGWRTVNKKIVFTNGCFDILHHGHIDYLAKAASLGNMLVVGVNTDASVRKLKGKDRPVNHQDDRAFQLASLMFVDAICMFEEDTPQTLIELLRPDVLAKGGDYTIDRIVGADFVLGTGGQVEIIPFVEGYSTTALIDHIKKL